MALDQVVEMVARSQRGHARYKRFTFTLESARGETYNRPEPVLYAHSTYERGSVLSGKPQRIWVESWDSWEEARTALAEFKKANPKFKYTDEGPTGGSSHIPIEQMVAHLPDDTNY